MKQSSTPLLVSQAKISQQHQQNVGNLHAEGTNFQKIQSTQNFESSNRQFQIAQRQQNISPKMVKTSKYQQQPQVQSQQQLQPIQGLLMQTGQKNQYENMQQKNNSVQRNFQQVQPQNQGSQIQQISFQMQDNKKNFQSNNSQQVLISGVMGQAVQGSAQLQQNYNIQSKQKFLSGKNSQKQSQSQSKDQNLNKQKSSLTGKQNEQSSQRQDAIQIANNVSPYYQGNNLFQQNKNASRNMQMRADGVQTQNGVYKQASFLLDNNRAGSTIQGAQNNQQQQMTQYQLFYNNTQSNFIAVQNNQNKNGSEYNEKGKTQIFANRSNSQQNNNLLSQTNKVIKQKSGKIIMIQNNKQQVLDQKIPNGVNQNQKIGVIQENKNVNYQYDLSCYNDATRTQNISLFQGNSGQSTVLAANKKNIGGGSVPLKYGSTESRSEPARTQNNSQAETAFLVGGQVDSRNNASNIINQTLFTNISLRGEINSQSPDGRKDATQVQNEFQNQKSKKSTRSKKIQITSGKHNLVQVVNSSNIIHTQNPNINKFSRTNIFEAKNGSPQYNTQVDLNLSGLSHQDLQATGSSVTQQMIQQNLLINNRQQPTELRQYLTNLNGNQMISNQPGNQLENQNLYTDNSQANQQKLQQPNGNPILNIKTVQDINIYNNSFIVNTNNAGNLQNLQALMSGQQQNQVVTQTGQNIFQNQVQIQNQANNLISGLVGPQEPVAQTSNRASQNKRILKLRKELSGLSSGFNQSRSASQGRAIINSNTTDQVTNVNFNHTVGDGNYFQQQDSRGLQKQQNNKGHLSDLDLNRESNIYRSKAYEAYNNNESSIVNNASRNSSTKTAGRNVMNHILQQQNNLKNLAQNPNQKRIIGNPNSVGKLFGNQGQQVLNRNIGNMTSAGALVHGQSQKQKMNNINQQIGFQTGYYTNPKAMKQESSNKNKKVEQSNTTRINSKMQSRVGQNGTDGDPQQIMTSIGENQNQIISRGYIKQISNTQSSNNTGSRAQSHTNHIQKVKYNGDQINKIMIMNKKDFNATSEGDGPIRADLNQSNFSYITEGELIESQTHSKSQVILSQLNDSHKYGRNTSNMAIIGKTNIYQQNPQKLVNLNSYEIRKQSLQDIRGQNSNVLHKFKNQLQQHSSDHESRYSHNNELVGHPTQIINSVSIKNEQLLSLGGLNRIKTQDANSKEENFNAQQQNLMSPMRQKQEKLSQKAIQTSQDMLKQLYQAAQKLYNQINQKSIQMSESELKQLEKNFDQLVDRYDQFLLGVRENIDQFIEIQNAVLTLKNIEEQAFDQMIELQVYKALTLVDQGSNHEAIQDFDRIINTDQSYNQNKEEQNQTEQIKKDQIRIQKIQKRQQFCFLMKSILQRKIGEFEQAQNTASECIQMFQNFKDAYFVRGQINLLQKKNQKATLDFTEYNNIAEQEYQLVSQNSNNILPQTIQSKNQQPLKLMSDLQKQYCLHIAIGKESLGDAYKLLKKHKLAYQSYEESLLKLNLVKQNTQTLQNNQKNTLDVNFNGTQFIGQLEFFIIKVKLKIAMSLYYQGKMQNSFTLLEEIKKYFTKFDFESLKVQQKLIKCSFYMGKSILANLDNQLEKNGQSYQEALQFFYFCTKDEFDPEIHELYSGNSFFEISKIFLKQRDILNAYEFMQRANDNNYNSKRLSLYRDFTEGVVYLMKRKIKKGVQILTDLLEVLINGQKEIEKTRIQAQIIKEEGKNNTNKQNVLDRYGNKQSKKEKTQSILSLQNSSVDQTKSTINGKANLIASGKFDEEMYNYLIFNIHIYRAYGYVAIEKYEHALDDFRRAKKISPFAIDKATIYNKWLSRGILKMDTEEYLMASKYFSKASLIFPSNKDAFCLNVISIVRSYTFSLQEKFIDDVIKYDKVKQTREFLNIAIKCCSVQGQKQPSLYFFRGLLNFQVHDFYEALNDFNMAIKEEEEPTGQFHLARGRCFACLSILDEALKDLSIALELDDSLLEAYIFRGKCAYLLGDNNLAFHDFQKLIISDQKNPLVHIYAGNLLMTTGAYTDAIKAFDNADTVQQTATAAFQRIRCFCALSDLEKAFEQMQLCKHQAPNEKFAQYDYKVLLSMLSCVRSFDFKKGENGQVDDKGQLEYIEILKNCVVQISSIIEIYEKGEHLQMKKGQSPMSIQIIPNVGKIKIEKRYVMRYLSSNQNKNLELPPLKPAELKSLKDAERFGYYRENIFQLEDMYLYRGVYKMYLGNYDEALVDFNKSWNHHFQLKKQALQDQQKNQKNKIDTDLDDEMYGKYPASQLVSPINSVHSYQSHKTDLSDIGLCSLNLREYNYNCIIMSIQMKNWDQALKKINEELSTSVQSLEQSKNIKQLYLVRAMIFQELGQTDKYNQDLTVYLKNFSKIQKNSSGAVIIEPFDVKGRLCEQFEPVKMNFQQSKGKQKSQFQVWMRPSFSMPFIKPPNMIPNIDEEAVQSEFNLKQIDAPMPETPWNRQCRNQNFKPIKYNQQNDQPQKKDQKVTLLPTLPLDQGNLMFLQKYQIFQSEKAKQVLFDPNVMADIDDISDTEKVSLISDIELFGDETDEKQIIDVKQNKQRIQSFADIEITKDNLENGLNLKKLDEIKKIGQPFGQKVSNGIKISQQKHLCRHKRSCSSCYRIPLLPDFVNIANQDIFVSNLTMNRDQKEEKRRKLLVNEEILPSTTLYNKADQTQIKNIQKFEDTVSDEEGMSSDSSQEKKENSQEKKKKKIQSHSGSQSSHSRFSSNVGDLSIRDDVGQGIKNIEESDIQVGEIDIKQKKNLKDDPAMKKLQKTDKQNYLNKNIQDEQIVVGNKEFINRIGSIQQEKIDSQISSPYLNSKTPEKNKLKEENERDSMVIMGSFNNADGTGIKKKSKRAGGIGGTNNLKKNKLAIAFNNIENTD